MRRFYIMFKGMFLKKTTYKTILSDRITTENIEEAHSVETELKAKQSIGVLNRGKKKDFTYKAIGKRKRIQIPESKAPRRPFRKQRK